MDSTIIQALITASSSLLGAVFGVIASSRLTNYRLEMLEKEVKELSTKTDDVTILKEQMKGVIEDVKELKKR